MKRFILLFPFILTGCPHTECKTVYHDTLRHQYFMDCLNAQKQPEHNHEDDNGHIVNACDTAARYQSTEFVCEEVK